MWQRILGCILVPFIAGCSTFSKQNAAPVIEIGISQGTHIVQRGETLYEIAWRYGRDFRDIAAANRISSPYVIYPGQKISLKEGTTRSILPSVAKPTRHSHTASLGKNPKEQSTIQKRERFEQSEKLVTKNSAFKNDWMWPVHGKIIKRYSAQGIGLKGIDLSGRLGTPIKAAAAGKVVYSGHGLRGYGQLIIIKHNDTYLSAYGHNDRLLVKEGQSIDRGQVIAEMGRTDAEQVKLHFEIRKNGKPIDPLSLLPRP